MSPTSREPHLQFSSVALMLEKPGTWRCSRLLYIVCGTGYRPAIQERDRKKVGKDKKNSVIDLERNLEVNIYQMILMQNHTVCLSREFQAVWK